jgi:tRNA(adenine34) deaminase
MISPAEVDDNGESCSPIERMMGATPTQADVEMMRGALAEADAAAAAGEVPVGCVVVDAHGREIARAHNAREVLADPTAHAEMLALREAAARSLTWRLDGATVYVTLEPCPMCAGALVNARVARVVYGCADPKAGAITTMFGVGTDGRLNHRFLVTPGVLGDECAARLIAFFRALRGSSP